MKYTNNLNLPMPLFNALTHSDYDLVGQPDNIVSVTTLLSPPRQKILESRHKDEIVIDCISNLWMMEGTASHYVAEISQGDSEHLVEERWYLSIATLKVFTVSEGVKFWETTNYDKQDFYVSGKFDVYDFVAKKLHDYKRTSVYSWLSTKKLKPEYVAQLNINRFALNKLGFDVCGQSIIFIFRDWSKTKAKTQGDYPKHPIMEVNAMPWYDDEIIDFVRGRVNNLIECRKLTDEQLPVCTPEERWRKEGKWAVMKKGRKTAVKLFDERPDEQTMATYGKDHWLEQRESVDTRCIDYCRVKEFCKYYQGIYAGKEEVLVED